MTFTRKDHFIQAIHERPADDTPRLLYADWLDEQGDPRGEFIRVQIALTKMAEDDPRWDMLKQRERELWRANKSTWLVEEARLRRDGALTVTWSRGFPDTIRIDSRNFLRNAHSLLNTAPIASLDLLWVDTDDACRLATRPELSRISRLNIYGALGSPDLRPLLNSQYLSGVRHLGWFCLCTADDVNALATSPYLQQLEGLDLSGTMIGNEGVSHLIRSRLRLKTLRLRNAELDEAGVEALCSSRLAAGLEELDLSDNEIGNHAVERLVDPRTSQLRQLRRLSLSNCDLHLGGISALASSPLVANIRRLDLSYNAVGRPSVEALASGPHLTNLRELVLENSEITESGAKVLADSLNFAGLTSLNLSRNSLGNGGVIELAHSPHLSKLRHLYLRQNAIGRSGVRALAQSPRLASLVTLDLSGNRFGPEGVQELVRSPLPPHLDSLRLNENDLGDDGVRLIANAPSLSGLRHLELTANRIGEAGATALAQGRLFSDLETLALNSNIIRQDGVRALGAPPHPSQLERLDIRESHADVFAAARTLVHTKMLPNLLKITMDASFERDSEHINAMLVQERASAALGQGRRHG